MGDVVDMTKRVPSVRERIQPAYHTAHAAVSRLILALRKEGQHEAADAVTQAMSDAGKAVTRACR
jgi:hypothetical protein